MKLEFSGHIFKKNSQISNFKKIRAVGAELFRSDGWTDGRQDRQTDMTKLILAFRCFAKAQKKTPVSYRFTTGLHVHM